MSTIKRASQPRRSSSYTLVSTRGSSTSRSPSPTTSNGNTTTTEVKDEYHSSDEFEDIDVRSSLEKELFDLVNKGLVQDVQNFIRVHRSVDINKKDTEELSILQHAVMNNDEQMVDILLKDNFEIDVYDALLEAIKQNMFPIVLKIWNWKETMRSKTRATVTTLFPKRKIKPDNAEYYGGDITPLLMAAMSGHYELMEFLYSKGERLGRVHLPACSCNECGPISQDLKKTGNRVHLLKGLANPTYLAFMAGADKTFDPILKAFEIIKDLQTCVFQEPEFREDYENILKDIKMFPVDLLAQCRNTEETMIFLNQKGYGSRTSGPHPRLMLAIHYEQKEFVAHYNSQDVLYQKWNNQQPWVAMSDWESFLKYAFIAVTALFFPFISIILPCARCCFEDSWIVKYLTSPMYRYYCAFASHAIFLLVLFCMNSEEKATSQMGPPSYYLPWIVGIFVLSQCVSFVKHWKVSSERFFFNGWNIFEIIHYIFFLITIGLWIDLWHLQSSFGTVRKLSRPYILKRQWLDSWDTLLISEMTTAIASTMAGLRLLKMIILHETLGPLQIALSKMTNDIAKFAVFFIIIIFSFSLGVLHLYKPYQGLKTPCNLCDWPSTVESLIWALFTMTDSSSPGLPAMNANINNKAVINHHFTTESVGKIIFVAYHILCVTFLFNMLVGVMSNTYGNIQDNVNVEWKYERAKVWLHYMQDDTITPFNILPNCHCIGHFILWVKAIMSKTDRKRARCNFAHCCYVEDDETEQERKDRIHKYPILIRRLMQRYFRSRSTRASEDPPVTDDIKQVQRQVIELRTLTTMTFELHSNPNSGTQINQQNDISKSNTPPVQSENELKTLHTG